jgi:hypothetical protein
VFACEWGLAISAEGKGSEMKNIRVHHNLLFENRASGLLFGVWGHDRPRNNIAIYNNTIAHNGSPGHWAGKTGGIDIRSRNLEDVFIFNNIVAENWAFEFASFASGSEVSDSLSEKNIRIENNLLYGNKEIHEEERFFNQVYAFVPNGSIISDPQFKNTGLFRYGLKKNSPAIDKGKIINGLGTMDYIGSGEDLNIWFRD